MKTNSFFKLFPIPDYLAMPAAGLDISDQSIKVVQLAETEAGPQLTTFGEVEMAPGAIENGEVKNVDELKVAIGKLKATHKFDHAIVALPEERAYIIKLKIPFMPEEDIRDTIELQLEEHIPLLAADVVFDYEILTKAKAENESYELSVVVFPKSELQKYHEAVSGAGVHVLAYEVEAHSLARALIPKDDTRSFMVVDIGKTRTGLSIVDRGVVTFTSTLNTVSGDVLTKLIQKSLTLEGPAAETAKAQKGLLRSASNRDVFEALLPVVSTLRDEISRYYLYWQNKENVGALKLSKIVFCGGQALMPGLIEYIGANLDVPCAVGNPWVNIYDFNQSVPPIDFNNGLRFATAIGLAARNII